MHIHLDSLPGTVTQEHVVNIARKRLKCKAKNRFKDVYQHVDIFIGEDLIAVKVSWAAK